MKYYITTTEVFETLNKNNIHYAVYSIDKSKYIVITSDTLDDVLFTFSDASSLSTYTFENNTDWVGDNTGIEESEFEEIEYLSGL
jgi:hypothetical protein